MIGEKPMNLTSDKDTSKAEEFFFEVLVPLAKALHSDNDSFYFHKKPDSFKDTYFVKRSKRSMEPDDFDLGDLNSSEDLKKALLGMWLADGHAELTIMAEALSKLSENSHHKEDQSSDVSPFIYVMF
jgi:hypothetical protein